MSDVLAVCLGDKRAYNWFLAKITKIHPGHYGTIFLER